MATCVRLYNCCYVLLCFATLGYKPFIHFGTFVLATLICLLHVATLGYAFQMLATLGCAATCFDYVRLSFTLVPVDFTRGTPLDFIRFQQISL